MYTNCEPISRGSRDQTVTPKTRNEVRLNSSENKSQHDVEFNVSNADIEELH